MLDAPRSWVSGSPEQFPKPVIAAVNGYAIGNSCIFSFSCDLIVASDRAEWRLPQVSLGILPAYGGTTRLARHVGKGNAMRMALGFPLRAAAIEARRLAGAAIARGLRDVGAGPGPVDAIDLTVRRPLPPLT
jgi:enoyl-CoA hydratase/carnithine racemase